MTRLCGMLAMILLVSGMPIKALISADQSKDSSDPLKPYTTCKLGGDLETKEITRLPKSAEKYREIQTGRGRERVSVVDGYRVMFGYKDARYYFANVKVERSDPQSYAQDKEKVINELKHYSSTKQASKILYTDKAMLNAFEHYGIDRDVIDVGGTVGTHVLLHDADHVIVTIYFLNQEKKNRRFSNIDEYRVIKDDFLVRYAECLSGVAPQ